MRPHHLPAGTGLIFALAAANPAQAQFHETIQSITLPQIRSIEAAKPPVGAADAKFGSDVRAIADRAAKAAEPKVVSLDIEVRPGADLAGPAKALGGVIDDVNSDAAAGKVRVTLPAGAIRDLAKDPSVQGLHLAQRGRGNALVGYAADGLTVLGFDDPAFKARHLTGQRIKVGVISDSVDNHLQWRAAKAAGIDDSVTVEWDSRQDWANDEGLAMLEVIRAAAPDAKLFFAAGMESEVEFKKAVDKLLEDGCDIIVDDVVFPGESPFENDDLAKAFNAAAAKGVIFISAAGNLGNTRLRTSGTWEHDFQDGGSAGKLYTGYASGDLVRFQDRFTFNTIDDVLPGHVPTVDLFWAEPLGAPKARYDLFLIAGDSHLKVPKWRVAGYALSDGATNPHLTIADAHKGDSLVILRLSGSPSPALHLSVTNGALRYSTKGNIRGHRASSQLSAFAVTAVPGKTPFTKAAPADISEHDSDGPRQLLFEDDGSAVVPGGARKVHKPDFALVEGARTTLKGSLGHLTGTSSSAAYAAGLFAVALSCPARPDITRLREAIQESAIKVKPADGDEIGAGALYAPTFIAAACDPKPAAASPQPGPAWEPPPANGATP